jgi:hypothetical protein
MFGAGVGIDVALGDFGPGATLGRSRPTPLVMHATAGPQIVHDDGGSPPDRQHRRLVVRLHLTAPMTLEPSFSTP